jgi:hypothetical protein
MPWSAVASVGAALGGAYLQSESAEDATYAQGQMSKAAIEEQRRQYDLSRSDSAPWREAGGSAISRLSQLLGLNGGTGELNKKFSVADFMEDPVTKLSYQSGLDLGTQAIDRMAGARGSRNSGATLKELSRFGTDYTGQKAGESYNRFYGDQDRSFNRLAGVSGAGQTATTNLGAQGTQAGTNIGNIMTSLGNARGAGAIAQGNLWGGAVQNIGNWYNQNQQLNRILGSQGSGGTSLGTIPSSNLGSGTYY